jgi:hypothetical protein
MLEMYMRVRVWICGRGLRQVCVCVCVSECVGGWVRVRVGGSECVDGWVRVRVGGSMSTCENITFQNPHMSSFQRNLSTRN